MVSRRPAGLARRRPAEAPERSRAARPNGWSPTRLRAAPAADVPSANQSRSRPFLRLFERAAHVRSADDGGHRRALVVPQEPVRCTGAAREAEGRRGARGDGPGRSARASNATASSATAACS